MLLIVFLGFRMAETVYQRMAVAPNLLRQR